MVQDLVVPMRLLHVGVAALNQTPFDWSGNRDRILAAIGAARANGVSILCLPELCITGYQCEDIFASTSLHHRAAKMLFEVLAPASRDIVVSMGLPVYHQGAVYNSAALLVDGQVLGLSAKQFLAGDGIHYEPRWFKPWPAGIQTKIEILGRELPFGDLYYDVGGVRLGFEVCEDAWVADRPGTRLAKGGVDIILNPSASHFAFEKQAVRRRFVLEGSRAFGAGYLYANLLGNEAGRAIYDGGTLIAQNGRILVEGPRFSFEDFQHCSAVLDVDHSRSIRSRMPSFRPSATLDPDAIVKAPFAFPTAKPTAPIGERARFEESEHLKEEEMTRAVALGLFDYLRKSRSGGYVVSLSGGADSSACAVLVALMVRLAVTELGAEGFRRRLPHIRLDGGLSAIIKDLLVTLYQATENSSQTTREAARAVAEALGADHHELDVEPIVRQYRTIAEEALDRSLTWDDDDIALQNIQARARGPSAWMVANLRDMLLCATSNRSEAAVGYTTMDGDTCGGISPIAGIDKAFSAVVVSMDGAHRTGRPGPASSARRSQQADPHGGAAPRGRIANRRGRLDALSGSRRDSNAWPSGTSTIQ